MLYSKFKHFIPAAAILIAATSTLVSASTNVEKISYSRYGDCYKISNGDAEVIITQNVGPRVISYKLKNDKNVFAEMGDNTGAKTEFGYWHHWGGHRLWAAPEVNPRTYWPDNDPVKIDVVGNDTIVATPAFETGTHLQLQMIVKLDSKGSGVTVTHKITNKDIWPIEFAPWAMTIMLGGGKTIIPQEPFISHDDKLSPCRSMTLWNFTDMSDPRWTFGKKYIQLKTDENLKAPQKIGVANKQGWGAYLVNNNLFVTRFPYTEGANYADYGCNFETYTEGNFMEVESLGTMTKLQPNETVTYVEKWYLFDNVNAGNSEESLDKAIQPLLKQTSY